MPKRTALVVHGAIDSDPALDAVLQRYGWQPAETAADIGSALEALHKRHHDLLMIPMEQLDPTQLSSIEMELRREPGTSVIGTGGESDPALILRGLHAGIHEFLVRPVTPDDLARSLERLSRRERTEQTRGQVIAVYGPKGGLGSTTVAINLAFALARKHPERRVALADMAVSNGDVRLLLNIGTAYDLGDLVVRREHVDADVLASTMTQQPPGVWVLPASDSPEKNEALDGPTATTIIEQLSQQFGFVVVDCDTQMRESTLAALDAADRILTVTQLTIPALRSTQQALRLFNRLGYGSDRVQVVVNRYASEDNVSLEDASEVLKCDLRSLLPNDYHACARAITKGRPVVEMSPTTRLATEFLNLATRLTAAEPAAATVPPSVRDAVRRGRFRPFAR